MRFSRTDICAEQAAPLLHHDDAARARAHASAGRLMSRPLNMTWPFAAVSRVMARSRVVLPAPFGPEHGDEFALGDVRLVGLSAATRP